MIICLGIYLKSEIFDGTIAKIKFNSDYVGQNRSLCYIFFRGFYILNYGHRILFHFDPCNGYPMNIKTISFLLMINITRNIFFLLLLATSFPILNTTTEKEINFDFISENSWKWKEKKKNHSSNWIFWQNEETKDIIYWHYIKTSFR